MMKLGGRPAGWDVLSECPLDSKRPLSVFGCFQVVSFHGGLKPSTSSVFLNPTKAIEVVEIAMIAVKISGDRMLLHPWRHEFLQVCASVCSSDARRKGAFQLCPKKRHANSANSSKMCLKLSLIMFQVSPHHSWQLSTISWRADSRRPVIISISRRLGEAQVASPQQQEVVVGSSQSSRADSLFKFHRDKTHHRFTPKLVVV